MEKKKVMSTLSRLKGGLWVEVDDKLKHEETIDILPFEGEVACVSVDAGMTVNMGNYQSCRVGVMIAIPYYLSWLCEVKVQRSDFLKDDKFEKPPQAHMQFLAVPKGLIRHEEIPKGWGLLEVAGDEYGARVYKTMDRCELNLIPLEIAGGLVEQMVWTMWWRYRMGAMREFHRKSEYAIVERDSAKVSTIVEAVMSYLQANNKYLEEKGRGTLREYLSLSGVKRRVKGWTLEKAERLREEFQCRKN